MNVQAQKKNWIEWSGIAADELRVGWDINSFTKVDKITPSNPWEELTSALKPYKQDVFRGSPDCDPTVRTNPLKY